MRISPGAVQNQPSVPIVGGAAGDALTMDGSLLVRAVIGKPRLDRSLPHRRSPPAPPFT
jgi:hypothetical protein